VAPRCSRPTGESTRSSTLERPQRGGTRPYGAALLIGGIDNGEPRLFAADPSGTPNEWKATAIGGGRSAIQDVFEAEWEPDLSVADGIELCVQALAEHDDEFGPSDLAVAAVTEDGYSTVPEDDVAAAFEAAGVADDDDSA